MELILLGFTGGMTLAMVLFAFSGNLATKVGVVIFPIFLTLAWYTWATEGVYYFAEKTRTTLSSKLDRSGSETTTAEQPTEDFAELGQTGDLFGGINALFAALAFSGVAVAAYMQAKSLDLSRQQHLQQSFEPLFFRLLELHREVSVAKLNLRSRINRQARAFSSVQEGEIAVDFPRAMSVFRRALRMKALGLRDTSTRGEKLRTHCAQYYEVFHEVNQNALGAHFRTLYQIFKLIDTSEFDKKHKNKYASIARSTLTEDQVFLLAINSLSQVGVGFVVYIERYGLLKHIARSSASPTIDQRICEWCYTENSSI